MQIMNIFLFLIFITEVNSGVLLGLKNNTLKFWIRNDLQSLKRLSQFRNKTYQKLNHLCQSIISFYHDASIEYYSMSEDDRDLLNNIIDLII